MMGRLTIGPLPRVDIVVLNREGQGHDLGVGDPGVGAMQITPDIDKSRPVSMGGLTVTPLPGTSCFDAFGLCVLLGDLLHPLDLRGRHHQRQAGGPAGHVDG